jgi:hypothetical protein
VLGQHPHLRDGGQQLTVVGEPQGPTKELELPVDGRVRAIEAYITTRREDEKSEGCPPSRVEREVV